MAKSTTKKGKEELSLEERFWNEFPQAPCLLKVNDEYFLLSSEAKAKDLARMSGTEVERIINPKLNPSTTDAS